MYCTCTVTLNISTKVLFDDIYCTLPVLLFPVVQWFLWSIHSFIEQHVSVPVSHSALWVRRLDYMRTKKISMKNEHSSKRVLE